MTLSAYPYKRVIEFATSPIVCCCITMNTCSNLKFHCCYKSGNSGDISYLLPSLMVIYDVIMTSLSVYLFTVSVNLVYVKLWGLATKILIKKLHDSA